MAILITGATGLLGGALTAALIAKGHAVVALVNRNRVIRDNGGNELIAKPCDLTSQPIGLCALQGDIRQPGLGLGDAERAWLEQHIRVVIHCAAIVQFEASWNDLEAVNVGGTRHVAQLCPSARFIHVSTAYVCGLADGPIAEAPCNAEGPFGNRYEQSKAQAEAFVRQLRPDSIIARPSIIVGEASSGRIRSFDTIYRAFKFIAEGKITEVPALPTATLNFVPIDHVINGIIALVGLPEAHGQIVHLAARTASPAVRFLTLIGAMEGLHSPRISAPEHIAMKRETIAVRLARPYWGYFRRHPEFATDALAKLAGINAPEMDDAAVLRQIAFCLEHGFIRASR